jgi:hypothetical protein
MAEPSFAQQMATLNSTLRAIEVRLALGRVPAAGFEDFKDTLDSMRHRLWGWLSAAAQDDPQVQERFRIRRATELCRGLGSDLRSGAISGHTPELSGLQQSTLDLVRSIEQARGPAS